MTLLEAPDIGTSAVEPWNSGNSSPVVKARAATRRYRGVRNAGFARLEDLERKALSMASDAPLSGLLSNIFEEARGILAEQISELDHCLKQAYGARPPAEASTTDYDRLTGAEKRVFAELAKGKPNKIIAYDLAISEATVKAHVSKILKKLKVHSRNRAIAMFAARNAD